jgi:hypothetical protein
MHEQVLEYLREINTMNSLMIQSYVENKLILHLEDDEIVKSQNKT